MKAHPRTFGSFAPPSKSMSHDPTREFTPSTPNPALGHPKPRAMVGGKAKGKEEAEKKVMERMGVGRSCLGGMRICVARSTFSGMERKEGILYLKNKEIKFSNVVESM